MRGGVYAEIESGINNGVSRGVRHMETAVIIVLLILILLAVTGHLKL